MDCKHVKVGFGVTAASSLGLQQVQAVWVSWMSLIQRGNGTKVTIHFYYTKKLII